MSLPSSADDLYEKIKQIWEKYPKDELVKYIEVYPAALRLLFKQKSHRILNYTVYLHYIVAKCFE